MTLSLADLPDKLNYSIGEVSKFLELPTHVLRYWEKEFPQLNPVKRAGNRRFYRRTDVALLIEIRYLLYERRFTISGARNHLRLKEVTDPMDLLRLVRDELRDLHQQLTASTDAPLASTPPGTAGQAGRQ